MPATKTGRRPRLEADPQLGERIARWVAVGNFLKVAAAMEHVPERSLFDWLKRGERYAEHLEGGGAAEDVEVKYLEFLEVIRHAEAEAEAGAIARIREAMLGRGLRTVRDSEGQPVEVAFERDPDPKWAAWYLERKHNDRWGRATRPDATLTPDDGEDENLDATVDGLTAQLEQAHEKLAAIAANKERAAR